jgi:hypothetical protein
VPPTYPGDDAAKLLALHLATGSQLAKEEIENRNATREEGVAAETKKRDDAAAAAAKVPKTVAEMAIAANDPTRTPAERAQFAAALKLNQQSSPAAVQVNNAGGVSPDAIDTAAQKYNDTGQLPGGLGSRGLPVQTAIMNRAAAMRKESGLGNADLAATSAGFRADSASLTNTTKALDNLTAFETSAIRNLKLFTDAADKIPDTGIPWLNTPVRLLDEKLVGSENMAAVNAARNIGLREIARITNDPKMSGQLTDTAHKEVMDFSPANATLGQIRTVAKLVQQDVANIHAGLAGQKAAIQARIGQGAQTPAAVPPTPPAAGQIVVKDGNGKPHPFATEAQAAAFEARVKAAGGVTSR